jgi:formyl-CoA transferase
MNFEKLMPDGALDGIRVIDCSRVLAGPYASQILGDHGADVIKVEPPQGDETRDWGPPFREGDASYFVGLNRNKRAIALDLKEPEAQAVLLQLLDGADVLIENLKPGTLESWGLGWAALGERFPRLIHCSITGFGADGPLGGFPGYDAVVQAMTGMFSINGPAGGEPTRLGIPIVDIGTGLYATIAIAMALYERSRSGRGQHLDITLYDCGLALMHPHMANFFMARLDGRPVGNAHPNIAPYDRFATGTVPLFIAIGNDRAFARLCRTIGAEALVADPRFATNADRSVHRDALKVELETVLAGFDGTELWPRLLREGLAAGPINTIGTALEHPHTAHRRMIVRDGDYAGVGTPIKMSRSQDQFRGLPPRFAEHREAVLDILGLDCDARRKLVESSATPVKRRQEGR